MAHMWTVALSCLLFSAAVLGDAAGEEEGTPGPAEPRAGLCYLPNVVGSCRAAFTRYYYDVTDQTCKTFVYGGCQGNANNFESQEDCESACGGVTGTVRPAAGSQKKRMMESEDEVATPEPPVTSVEYSENCLVPPVVGPCRASIQKYFYNSSVGTCQIFTYGGCKGNKNNYPTLEMCMATCKGKAGPNSKKTSEVVFDKENCGKPSDSGMCRAAFPMYYYDSNTKGCEKFIYGGCGGNENRFFSQDECTTKCAESDGTINAHGLGRWTAGIFLSSTLAVLSAILLVSLIMIIIRRARTCHRHHHHHHHHHHRILDDKEELLSSDQLSQEHLSKLERA
ncbi:kunitz-type protease inhibitor 2 [Denticeps clupeoides]|uniref:kunitz-type protease inhibitor 2 n=1 Tax=Denticeps clupeoides TaxID=299321 RepID=UPI0010A549EA|nr:kunitz-type protease inhibitor 2-like [Denticeps clupeoides]